MLFSGKLPCGNCRFNECAGRTLTGAKQGGHGQEATWTRICAKYGYAIVHSTKNLLMY
jgi:hypothetical protein